MLQTLRLQPKLLIVLSCALVSLICSCQHVSPSKAATQNGWRALFDGHTTNGWQMTGPGEFKLENGELVTYGGMGLLWFPEKFGNCQIRVVFKLSASDDNSGVFIRIPEPPNDPWFAVNKGYEVQICNANDEWHRTGCLYSLTQAKNAVTLQPGQWTVMLITLDGKRTRVQVDGRLVTDFTEGDPVPPKKIWYEPERGERPASGYIGLQNHGGQAQVHFKEVSIRPLR